MFNPKAFSAIFGLGGNANEKLSFVTNTDVRNKDLTIKSFTDTNI